MADRPDREAGRAARLERIAYLATLPKVTTAKHLFDANGEREARARAGERLPTVPVQAAGLWGPIGATLPANFQGNSNPSRHDWQIPADPGR